MRISNTIITAVLFYTAYMLLGYTVLGRVARQTTATLFNASRLLGFW